MNQNEDKAGKIVLWVLEGFAIIGFIYLLFYFINAYSNYGILKNVPYDFKKGGDNNYLSPNEKGDALGGVLNPIIGIIAILVTYLAFFIQFLANKQVQNQFKIQQFESQFYEMLRIHKDNVNEMYLSAQGQKFEGRYALELIYSELIFSYNTCKTIVDRNIIIGNNSYKLQSNKDILIYIYRFWFYGIEGINKKNFDDLENLCLDELKFQQSVTVNGEIPQSILKGHQFRIAHYYRHLFQTVKFIVSENERFISYEEKRKYLRILRAQLSNHEQALLFFNWYSDFGYSWEESIDSGNKFFSDYRMIHNLYPELILNIYDLNLLKSKRKENNDSKDNIFDFQDWE